MATVATRALLLSTRTVGEADLQVTLLTEVLGVVVAVGRSAQRSARRMPALEPLHQLDVRLDDRGLERVAFLLESSVAVQRVGILAVPGRIVAAGKVLRWARAALPQRMPDPDVWREMNAALERLVDAAAPPVVLAEHGLRLLGALGWGLDFTACVRCGRRCAPGSAASVSASAGGLVCRACGGSMTVLHARQRERLAAGAIDADDVGVVLQLVDDALQHHASVSAP